MESPGAAVKFSKLLLPMIGLCVVSQAILLSFAASGGTLVDANSKNYYTQLDLKEQTLLKELHAPPGANPEKLRKVGLIYWQNNKIELAEPCLAEVWNEHQSANTTTYDEQFVQDGLNLAGLYLDRGSNELAILIYKRLLEYDSAHLAPEDARIARDWNNLGLAFLQTGTALPEFKARKAWFDQAVIQFSNAEKIFSANPKYEQQMVCTMQNLVDAYSEMGEDDKAYNLSLLVNKHYDQWNRDLKNSATPPVKSPFPFKNTSTINFRV